MNTLLFGAARDIITPPQSMSLMGFGSVFGEPFEDIHDDLFVRLLVLRAGLPGTGDTVIISFDLLFHDDTLAGAVAAYAAQRYGVPRAAVLVHNTHTHFGPAAKGYDITHYKPAYEQFLIDRTCVALDRAYLSLRCGTMETTAVTGDWNISRRRPVEGDTLFVPNLDGDRDPNLYLMRLRDERGRVRALLLNYACHPSNANAYHTVSSEYPGRLCALIEARNYGCTAIFVQGAGSDTKLKIGGRKTTGFSGVSFEEIDEAAASMARRAQDALMNADWVRHRPSFAASKFTIPLPLEVWPKTAFDAELTQHPGGDTPGEQFYHVNAKYLAQRYDELPDHLPLSCGVVKLADDLYIFAMGGEPCADIRRLLAAEVVPDSTLFFFGYADACAYVPSDKLLREGGYEAGGRAVPEYRLKGDCRPGVDALYTSYFKQAVESLNV